MVHAELPPSPPSHLLPRASRIVPIVLRGVGVVGQYPACRPTLRRQVSFRRADHRPPTHRLRRSKIAVPVDASLPRCRLTLGVAWAAPAAIFRTKFSAATSYRNHWLSTEPRRHNRPRLCPTASSPIDGTVLRGMPPLPPLSSPNNAACAASARVHAHTHAC